MKFTAILTVILSSINLSIACDEHSCSQMTFPTWAGIDIDPANSVSTPREDRSYSQQPDLSLGHESDLEVSHQNFEPDNNNPLGIKQERTRSPNSSRPNSSIGNPEDSSSDVHNSSASTQIFCLDSDPLVSKSSEDGFSRQDSLLGDESKDPDSHKIHLFVNEEEIKEVLDKVKSLFIDSFYQNYEKEKIIEEKDLETTLEDYCNKIVISQIEEYAKKERKTVVVVRSPGGTTDLGCALTHEKEKNEECVCHIDLLAVHKDHFKEGIGSEILKKLQQKYEKITLDVRTKNAPALALYKKNDFDQNDSNSPSDETLDPHIYISLSWTIKPPVPF